MQASGRCAKSGAVRLFSVYFQIDNMIRNSDAAVTSDDSRLIMTSVLHENKIAKVHAIWKGERFENMDILIDIVIVCSDTLLKTFRHNVVSMDNHKLPVFNFDQLRHFRQISPCVVQGYILSKAIRLASIAKPKNIDSFDLEESVKVDDVITSHLLTIMAIDIEQQRNGFETLTTFDVALNIYKLLQSILINGYSNNSDYVTARTACQSCKVERGCCKRRKLMKEMVENIIDWLKNNKDRLQDIDFADDDDWWEVSGQQPLLSCLTPYLYYESQTYDPSTFIYPPRLL